MGPLFAELTENMDFFSVFSLRREIKQVYFVPVSFDLQIQYLKMTEIYGAGVAPALHTAGGGRAFSRAERPVPPLMSHPVEFASQMKQEQSISMF